MKKLNNIELIISLFFLLFVIIFILMIIKSNENDDEYLNNERLEYEIIDNNTYGRVRMRGFYIEDTDSGIDVIIGMGSKSTGGYSITLDKIVMEEGSLIIYVNESSPKPTDIVTQAFTYPTLKIKIKNNNENIKVINQNGLEFKKLN